MRFRIVALLGAGICLAQQGDVNPDSALINDFTNRVDQYMKLHKDAASKLPLKPTESQSVLKKHRRQFAALMRASRPQAAQGDIFTPGIVGEFKRLVGMAMAGARAGRIQKSMKRSEPVAFPLKVNDSYPERVPLQSTPPSLLLGLPTVPPGLEYRVIGHNLILRDVDANLIIDFALDVIP